MLLEIVFMTFDAEVIAPVFHRKVLPFLDIAKPVVGVGKTVAMDAEVVRNQELPGEQDQSYQCDCKPQRVQDMPLHVHLSLCLLALERSNMISTTYFFGLLGLPELRRRHPQRQVNRSVLMT